MRFNRHTEIEGKHAFLSPSSYHWVNYDDQKLEARFISATAAQRGTDLHEFAKDAIRLGINLPDEPRTMNMYVNDGIGYKMEVEQPLYYSRNCFGHVDAISFRNGMLRIHDLKNGITAVKFTQLEIYAALFCLEYGVSPLDIDIELRIYQRDEVLPHIPTPERILYIMDKIVTSDARIEEMKESGTW